MYMSLSFLILIAGKIIHKSRPKNNSSLHARTTRVDNIERKCVVTPVFMI